MVEEKLRGYLARSLRGEQTQAHVKVVSRADFVKLDVREEMKAI